MHVGVDQARQQCRSAAIDDLRPVGGIAADTENLAVLDEDGDDAQCFLAVEDLCIGDGCRRHSAPRSLVGLFGQCILQAMEMLHGMYIARNRCGSLA